MRENVRERMMSTNSEPTLFEYVSTGLCRMSRKFASINLDMDNLPLYFWETVPEKSEQS